MNIYQCQAKAEEIGFDKAKFTAEFPVGTVECEWVDAYFGLLKADVAGLKGKTIAVAQIDQMFPELICSAPWKETE